MAFERAVRSKTYLAASAINAFQPVSFLGALTPGSARDETVVPQASFNIDVLGVARATVATPGLPVQVDLDGWTKVLAAASIGAGSRIVVGSTNGVVILSAVGTVASQIKYSIGTAEVSAVTGDLFAIKLKPEQIV